MNEYITFSPRGSPGQEYQWKTYIRNKNVFRFMTSDKKYELVINPLPKKFSIDYEMIGHIYIHISDCPYRKRTIRIDGNIKHGFRFMDRLCSFTYDYVIFKSSIELPLAGVWGSTTSGVPPSCLGERDITYNSSHKRLRTGTLSETV